MPPATATTLLDGVVDYAGLFPPAGLAMPAALADYAAARAGADAWMLGRFVLPASRLAEFSAAREAAGARDATDEWRLSAIVREGAADDVSAVAECNTATGRHRARVDSIESKPATLDGVDWLAGHFGRHFEVYVEIGLAEDLDAWLARVKAHGLRAKVRTGGITAEAFPTPAALAAFLAAVVRHDLVFKATAGLHHAVRGAYRLTYEPAAAQAPMYGYLNVLLAASALRMGRSVAEAAEVLQRSDSTHLVFTDEAVRWGADVFPRSVLHDTRARHLASFGSCSFQEPAGEFGALVSR